jgi:predicted nucleotidyltransferase
MATVAKDAKAVLRQLKKRLLDLYGERLAHVILFGSFARGDASEDSDIDVLIVLRGSIDPRAERKRTLDLIAGLSLEHNVLISDIITSEEHYSRGEAPLFKEVQREGVRL